MTAKDLWTLLEQIGIHDLHESGNGWFNGLCPYHNETRRSWGISQEEPHFFNCFGCKAKGPLNRLLVDIGGLSETRAQQLAAKPGPIRSRDLFLDFEERPPRELDAAELFPFGLNLNAKIYLRRRGISITTANALGIVFEPSLNRLLFPWFLGKKEFNVKLFGVTGRTIFENDPLKTLPMYGTLKGQSLYFPNRTIKRRAPFIIVEGEIDAALVWQANYRNVGATGFGSFTPQQAKQVLNGANEVCVFTDDDEAGELLYKEIVKKISPHLPISRVNYSRVVSTQKRLTRKMDPAELWKLVRGSALIQSAIQTADKNSDFPEI